MFTKSESNKQIDLFGGVTQMMPEKKQKILDDPKEWHNVFYNEITSKIDETVFEPLYSMDRGRPNAPLRVLVGMLVLKDGHRWTDEQLFDQCRFNMRVMLALGLPNLELDVPVESTYYDFQSKLISHRDQSGESLLDKSFQQVTQDQIKRHKVLAHHVRMDSKLIQSNIRRCTRLHLVIETVRKFYSGLDEKQKKRIVKKYDREYLESLVQRTAMNHTFHLTNEEKDKWLGKLGHVIRKLLNIYAGQGVDHYEMLKRLYEEQYEEKSQQIDPKDKSEIPADSIQSPHDQDAHYRKKGHGKDEQQVTGYVANITETCHEDQLNLVTNVQLAGATKPDNEFLRSAVEQTEQISQQEVEAAWTDGGYDGIENRQLFTQPGWEDKKWHLPKTKGQPLSYEFEQLDDGSIKVHDLKTGLSQVAELDKKGRYRVKSKRGKSPYRYFDKQVVESYLALNRVRVEDKDLLKKRANVEATIHQVFCQLNGGKTAYRGLARNENYVITRCFWTNFQRIKAKGLESLENGLSELFGLLLRILNPLVRRHAMILQPQLIRI